LEINIVPRPWNYYNYISKVIEQSICKPGGVSNVVAIVSDNAANYKREAEIITIKFPKITCVPCATHSLNLLLKDFGNLIFIN
jgi:hypothetical protein